MEPKNTRYSSAPQPAAVGISVMRSPLSRLAPSNMAPAVSISAALAIGPAGSGKWRLQTEPKAQVAAAKITIAAPMGLACRLEPRLSMPIPTSPRAMPAHSRRVLRAPQK